MLDIAFDSFFINGRLFDFSKETSEQDIIRVLGSADEIEDYDEKGKFLHYDNLRLSLSQDKLEYIDLFFLNSDASYSLRLENRKFTISKSTNLMQLLTIFNVLGMGWSIDSRYSNMDYLVVKVENGLCFSYYYGNRKLERLTSVL